MRLEPAFVIIIVTGCGDDGDVVDRPYSCTLRCVHGFEGEKAESIKKHFSTMSSNKKTNKKTYIRGPYDG